jgi:hypothetical protein
VVYLIDDSTDLIYQVSLSTAWDITTDAGSASATFSVNSQETDPFALFIDPTGVYLYVVGGQGDDVNQYTLSTAWDISSASYTRAFSISAQQINSDGIFFTPDGTKMFVNSAYNKAVFQYNLTTPWDISTASYASISFDLSVSALEGYGLFFGSNGEKFYTVSNIGAIGNDSILQYSSFTIPAITYPTNVTWPSGTAPTAPAIGDTDVITFTTRDGGTTYNASLAIDGAA